MEKLKNKTLYDILIENNEENLKNFLISKGKNPKPICPIQFINKEKENKDEWIAEFSKGN